MRILHARVNTRISRSFCNLKISLVAAKIIIHVIPCAAAATTTNLLLSLNTVGDIVMVILPVNNTVLSNKVSSCSLAGNQTVRMMVGDIGYSRTACSRYILLLLARFNQLFILFVTVSGFTRMAGDLAVTL
jgi:hypothetical protein